MDITITLDDNDLDRIAEAVVSENPHNWFNALVHINTLVETAHSDNEYDDRPHHYDNDRATAIAIARSRTAHPSSGSADPGATRYVPTSTPIFSD